MWHYSLSEDEIPLAYHVARRKYTCSVLMLDSKLSTIDEKCGCIGRLK